jgi:hypothetical protein
MRRWLYASLVAAGLAAALTPGRAAAQFIPSPGTFGRPPGNPMGTPTFSPYLNLGRGGNEALNYYGLVRPQVQAQQSIQQLQQQQYQLEQLQLAGMARTTGLPLPTGHPAMFGNYLQFYPATVGLGQRR